MNHPIKIVLIGQEGTTVPTYLLLNEGHWMMRKVVDSTVLTHSSRQQWMFKSRDYVESCTAVKLYQFQRM